MIVELREYDWHENQKAGIYLFAMAQI